MSKRGLIPNSPASGWPIGSSPAGPSPTAFTTPVFGLPATRPISNFITIQDFAALYGAAEFSLLNGYPLASHLIINWTTLGISDEGVADAFLAFTKRLRDYLTRRSVPPLWIYSHERGPSTGLHTHLAVFLPVDTAGLRDDFMEWFRTWPIRQFGRRVPRALRMRVPKAHDPRLHWLIFNYLMKGYDRAAVVQSARHAPGGKAIMLGDLIAFPWREPGITTMRKRFGFSQNLGPAQQAEGLPAAWTGLCRPAAVFKLTASDLPSILPAPPRPAFRSTFDDACYDVRQLYGAGFCEWKQVAPARCHSDPIDRPSAEDILGGYI